jgi:hypothetical protein
MAKQKPNLPENNRRNEADELPFWEGHLIRVKQVYLDNPSDDNRVWMENVQSRIERLQNLLQNGTNQVAVKPQFK